MNRLTFFLLHLSFVIFQTSIAKPTELRVEEVTLYLYAETVTGFEVVVNHNIKQVQTAIQKHLNERNLEPFIFNEIMVCPDIYYPPITHEQKLSIYYSLEEADHGKKTVLTFIAFYGYTHPINSQDDPDLALRMLLDMNELTSRYFGEKINFDHIFSQTTRQAILEGKEKRVQKQAFVAKVDSNQYYLNKLLDKDTLPVKALLSPTAKADNDITNELANRFQRYVNAPSNEETKPFYQDAASKDLAILEDSIRFLNETLYHLQKENSDLQEKDAYLSSQQAYWTSGKANFERSMDSLQQLSANYHGQNYYLQHKLDSLLAPERKNNFESRISQLEAQKKAAEKEANLYRSEWEKARYQADSLRRTAAAFKGEKEMLKKEAEMSKQAKSRLIAQDSVRTFEKEKQVKVLNQSIENERNKTYSAYTRMDSLRQLINKAEEKQQHCSNQNDSLMRIASTATTRIASLSKENERLRNQIAKQGTTRDSVARINAEIRQNNSDQRQRQQVYQQQINTLNDLLEEIKQREQKLAAGEARLKQREKYLTQYEKRGEISVLLNRIESLENEVSPNIQAALSTENIKEVSMIYANDLKPALLLVLPPNADVDKAEVVFRLRTKGLETTEQVPDLVYRNIYIEEITDRQLTMIVRVLDLGSEKNVIFAFQLPDDTYISYKNDEDLAKKAAAFLVEMFKQ